jgi:hypothetical protein
MKETKFDAAARTVDEIGDRFEQKVTVAAHDRIIGRINP